MNTYQIFGRTEYADPLTLIGSIRIENDATISQAVLDQHGKSDWVELIAIPDDKIIWARKTEADA